MIDRLAAHLLGCGVGHLAAEPFRLAVGGRRRAQSLGDSEVQQLHAAGAQAHDVRGADVAVNDVERETVGVTKVVRVAEPFGQLMPNVGRQRRRAGAPEAAQLAHHRREVAPAQVLHRQEVVSVDGAEVVDLNDRRVAEQRADARLLDEHLDEARRARQLGEDPLDDERARESLHPGQHGAEHLGHSTGVDLIEQHVTPEAFGGISSDIDHDAYIDATARRFTKILTQ